MPVHRVGKIKHRATLTALDPQFERRVQSPKPPVPPVTASPYDTCQPADRPRASQLLESQDIHTIDDEFAQAGTSILDYLETGAIADHEGQNKDNRSVQETRSHTARLELLNLDEWDENEAYDEDPPSCLRYSIEWKVTLNNKPISKDTEQNLVLAPRFYWSLFLRPKLEKLLQKKLPPSKRVTCDDTNVVVSVTGRSERDLTKRFDEADIDWFVIEKQLLAWGELFRAGKKLRVDLCFNYLEVGQQLPTSSKRVDKRGIGSATQQMLAERASQLDAEEEVCGQPPAWRDVYSLMRCPGPPCHLGPHCWRDPVGKKHYKLKTHQLRALINYVQQGGQLQTHDDVPEDIREQLYAEEQQRLGRHQKTTLSSSTSVPHINITNVLPEPSHQPLVSNTSTSMTPQPSSAPLAPRLLVPGHRDIAVKEYSDWQQSKVRSEALKAEFHKAHDVALADGLDLEQIYGDQDPNFFIKKGVKPGVARRFVSDIEYWVKRYKCASKMQDSDQG